MLFLTQIKKPLLQGMTIPLLLRCRHRCGSCCGSRLCREVASESVREQGKDAIGRRGAFAGAFARKADRKRKALKAGAFQRLGKLVGQKNDNRGPEQIRTAVNGFADRYLATRSRDPSPGKRSPLAFRLAKVVKFFY